jgi:hypothetical protein
MFVPSLRPWIEEGNEMLRARVNAFDMRLLEDVTPEAAEAQVVERVPSSSGLREDVVDSKLLSGDIRLRAAVFTQTFRTLLNCPPQLGREAAHRIRSSASARRSMI